jgi:uncharacterized RDD family membrane protein YckC
VSDTDDDHLDRHLDTLQRKLPERPSAWLQHLRTPKARVLRIPAAVLLVCGGLLGFLPVLGFWMLPLGVLLLSIDVPALKRPTSRALRWLERQWTSRGDQSKTRSGS